MQVIHFVRGRPKPESANGVLTTVYSLYHAQLKGNYHSVKIVGMLNPSKAASTDLDGLCTFLPCSRWPFKLSSKMISYVSTINSNKTVAHLHMVNVPQLYVLARCLRKYNIKYVISPHGGFSENSLKRSRIKKFIFNIFFQKYINKHAEKLIALTPREKLEFERFGIQPSKIEVIPNGLLFDEPIFKLNHIASDAELSVIFIGRLDYWHKGLDLLFSAFALLPERYCGRRVFLDIVGPDWLGGAKIAENIVKKLGIDERVRFHGAVFGEEKLTMLKAADVFVLASRNEGMPVSILEAIQQGVPVVISKETNISEEAARLGACVFVDLNSKSVATGLDFLLCSSDRRERMTFCAYQYAKDTFSSDQIVFKYSELFKKILT
jgi:glycosyltransferase involved in cell wall biosynthesis